MITAEFLCYRNLAIDALTIKPGITTIIGPNGSGKTTFLKLCAGIAVPDSGSLLIDDALPRETETGWVNEFPDRNILFVNVFDEIASPLRFRRIPCDEIDSNVRACADTMGITYLLKERCVNCPEVKKCSFPLLQHWFTTQKCWSLTNTIHILMHTLWQRLSRESEASGAEYVIRCTQQMDTAIHSDHLLFFDSGRITHAGTPHDIFPFLKGTAYYPLLWGC